MVNDWLALSGNMKRTSLIPQTHDRIMDDIYSTKDGKGIRSPDASSVMARTQGQSVSFIRFRLIRARRAAFCSACFLLPPLAGPKHFGPMKTFT